MAGLAGLHTAGGLVHFSLVLVQLDLVNLIPSFPLPGSAGSLEPTPAIVCSTTGLGVGLEEHWGGLLGIMRTKSSPT